MKRSTLPATKKSKSSHLNKHLVRMQDVINQIGNETQVRNRNENVSDLTV